MMTIEAQQQIDAELNRAKALKDSAAAHEAKAEGIRKKLAEFERLNREIDGLRKTICLYRSINLETHCVTIRVADKANTYSGMFDGLFGVFSNEDAVIRTDEFGTKAIAEMVVVALQKRISSVEAQRDAIRFDE